MNVVALYLLAAVVVAVLLAKRSKRMARVREATLEQRLLASALINPDDGKLYF